MIDNTEEIHFVPADNRDGRFVYVARMMPCGEPFKGFIGIKVHEFHSDNPLLEIMRPLGINLIQEVITKLKTMEKDGYD